MTTKSGLTLIELLGVLVVLSLVAAGLSTRLEPSGPTRTRTCVLGLADLDARARLHACLNNVVEIDFRNPGAGVRVVDLATSETIARLDLGPHGMLQDHPDVVRVDRAGQSADYELLVVAPDGTTRMFVGGATGDVHTAAGSP